MTAKQNTSLETDNDITEDGTVPGICSQRWILSYTGFLGFAIVFALRVNLSVAVVCMLKTANTTTLRYVNVTDGEDSHCRTLFKESHSSNSRSELDWSPTTKAAVLASFYYGYVVTPLPAGWVADRYGGKHVVGAAIGVPSVLTLLMPVCARTSIYLVYAIRVAIGLFTGLAYPAMHALWGRWAPRLERSRLTTLCYSGGTVGCTLTFIVSGLLCEYGFDNGWGSIFYVTGGLGCLWWLLWLYTASDSPSSHPRITRHELRYIAGNLDNKKRSKVTGVPWLSMARSPCLWACVVAHFCDNWLNYTALAIIPTFMKEVLQFDIKENGAVSALPYIAYSIACVLAGQLADYFRSRGHLSTVATRKLFQTLSLVVPAVCIVATGFCNCRSRELAVALLTICFMFNGLSRAGYFTNHIDFAPRFAGITFGVTNTVGTVSGMVAPIVAGLLTSNNLQTEWRNVFYVCGAWNCFGIIVYGLFASGEVQPWAKDEQTEAEVTLQVCSDDTCIQTTTSNHTGR